MTAPLTYFPSGVSGMDTIWPGSSGVDFNAFSKACNKGHDIFEARPAPDSIRRADASHGQRNLRVTRLEQKCLMIPKKVKNNLQLAQIKRRRFYLRKSADRKFIRDSRGVCLTLHSGGNQKMNFFRTAIASATLFVAFSMLFHTVFVHTGFAQVSSETSDNCGWPYKDLKQDWNYLFHPDRVNQCQPRRLEIDNRLMEQSIKAFTRDDSLIPRYCGSPFSYSGSSGVGAGKLAP